MSSDDALVGFLIGLVIGVMLSLVLCSRNFHREAIEHNAAHYNQTNSQFEWNK